MKSIKNRIIFFASIICLLLTGATILGCKKKTDLAWDAYYKAALYHGNTNYNSAINEYLKLIDLKPDCAQAYLGLEECYSEIGNRDRAVWAIEKLYQVSNAAILNNSNNYNAYFFRGEARWCMRDESGCLADLKTAVALTDPSHVINNNDHRQCGEDFASDLHQNALDEIKRLYGINNFEH